MHETFNDIYHSLKLYYKSNHFCRHISAECIGQLCVRQRVRSMIVLAIHDNQDLLREKLEELNERFGQYKAVFMYYFSVSTQQSIIRPLFHSADLHSTDDHPRDHWMIRMYDANNSHAVSLHICEDDCTTTARIVHSKNPRVFVYEYTPLSQDGNHTIVTYCFWYVSSFIDYLRCLFNVPCSHGESPLRCGGWSSVDE